MGDYSQIILICEDRQQEVFGRTLRRIKSIRRQSSGTCFRRYNAGEKGGFYE